MTQRTLLTAIVLAGCAKGHAVADGGPGGQDGTSGDTGPTADASCGNLCDHDHEGVVDGTDQCPDTPPGEPVNRVGCADSQHTPTLEPSFPPTSSRGRRRATLAGPAA